MSGQNERNDGPVVAELGETTVVAVVGAAVAAVVVEGYNRLYRLVGRPQYGSSPELLGSSQPLQRDPRHRDHPDGAPLHQIRSLNSFH